MNDDKGENVMSLLELRNISKIYGSLRALDNVSLKVDNGEWLAIMGPSGSGKSTLMNIIGCMDKPSLGEVILDGKDIAKESDKGLTAIRRDKIGLIFQQFHLVNYLTAVENVMVAQYYHSIPDEKEALEAKIKEESPVFGFGMGDVILMAAGGLMLGLKATITAGIIAVVLGAIYGVILKYIRRNDDSEDSNVFAFGPFLIIGLAVGAFVNGSLIDMYLNSLHIGR